MWSWAQTSALPLRVLPFPPWAPPESVFCWAPLPESEERPWRVPRARGQPPIHLAQQWWRWGLHLSWGPASRGADWGRTTSLLPSSLEEAERGQEWVVWGSCGGCLPPRVSPSPGLWRGSHTAPLTESHVRSVKVVTWLMVVSAAVPVPQALHTTCHSSPGPAAVIISPILQVRRLRLRR